jgi:hypothetical protein
MWLDETGLKLKASSAFKPFAMQRRQLSLIQPCTHGVACEPSTMTAWRARSIEFSRSLAEIMVFMVAGL